MCVVFLNLSGNRSHFAASNLLAVNGKNWNDAVLCIGQEYFFSIHHVFELDRIGCITNNFKSMSASPMGGLYKGEIMELFHHVIESAKAGVRKPDPRIYRMMTDALQVEPAACVYLDDLGINLKPARDMGMRTIKVGDARPALEQLQDYVGFALLD